MEIAINIFLDEIDARIQSRHLLKHEFYQAWSRGQLSKECLCEYSKEYYQHVKAFPKYISAIHSHTDDPKTRRILLENLVEEELGSPNHPELWKNFSLALGVGEHELENYNPSMEMKSLISTFHSICSDQTTAQGISALYAYESQIPEICISKIEGLERYYGMQNPKGWEYFTVHIEADKKHATEERNLLKSYITAENREMISFSVDHALEVLWNFLSGLCQKFNISCKQKIS